VSTGPLVWNRHKEKLLAQKVKGAIPLIWAECVDPSGSGTFTFKATGRNHVPWFKPTRKDDPNIVREACVLLQRTTSLEQSRRLVAAELPQSFIDENGGAVTVENHLNMVRPIPGCNPLVSSQVITALLNSETVDQIFRCINGSTAVSAYELESMPLPSPEECERLEEIIASDAGKNVIDNAIKEMYCDVRTRAAA
jgi:adenine-specific DNA-methyltransferase